LYSDYFDYTATSGGWSISSQSFTGPISFYIEFIATKSGFLDYSFDATAISPANATVKIYVNDLDPSGVDFAGSTISTASVYYNFSQKLKIVVNYTSVGFSNRLGFGPGGVTGYLNYLTGKIYSWGSNAGGQLGNDTTVNSNFPSEIYGDGSNWIIASVGEQQAGSVNEDGFVYMWGQNDKGQLGFNNVISSSTPAQMIMTDKIWYQLLCGKKFSGGLENTYLYPSRSPTPYFTSSPTPTPTVTASPTPTGTEGTPSPTPSVTLSPSPTPSPSASQSPTPTESPSPTPSESPSPTPSGTEPTPSTTASPTPTTTASPTVTPTPSVTAYNLFSWGTNSYGQLGDNSTNASNFPVEVFASKFSWSAVGAGFSHTGAIKNDGTLWVWGSNYDGQIGNSSTAPISSPQQVMISKKWAFISFGKAFSGGLDNSLLFVTPTPTPTPT
jgi:hypothetical protein